MRNRTMDLLKWVEVSFLSKEDENVMNWKLLGMRQKNKWDKGKMEKDLKEKLENLETENLGKAKKKCN